MEVVLPNGQVKTVTASTDRDLFFALRGGGNNFVRTRLLNLLISDNLSSSPRQGIVTRFTLKAHPQSAVWVSL